LYRLFIHEDALEDLDRLWVRDEVAAARIVALIQQLKGDQVLLDHLTQHGYGKRSADEFDVSKWHRQWKLGRDLWRLEAWDLEQQGLRYRVIYAYVTGERRYYVLGVLPREQVDYDNPEDPITRRILRAYDEL
jgi:hypothetical protein